MKKTAEATNMIVAISIRVLSFSKNLRSKQNNVTVIPITTKLHKEPIVPRLSHVTRNWLNTEKLPQISNATPGLRALMFHPDKKVLASFIVMPLGSPGIEKPHNKSC
jgi:hypothetical protein